VISSAFQRIIILMLLIIWVEPLFAQDDPIRSLSEEYAQLERMGLKENFHRQLSFTMLQEYLPPGTRMTSGYRSPQKQLDLIIRMAKAHNIPTPPQPTLEDEKSWMPTLMALRAKGFIIAAPTTTPHGTDEAVFDLSGADLGAIEEGLRRAEKAGMIKYKRIIRERVNNAVHVEIDSISPKALNALGRRKPGSQGQTSSGSSTGTVPTSESDQRRSMLQQLQELHDGEPSPNKKIDYDRSKRNLLDPIADAEQIRAIDNEILQHQQEADQLAGQGQRREYILKVSEALRERRFDEAEQEAEAYASKFPDVKDAQDLLSKVKTRRLINEAREALDSGGCSDCKDADRLIDEALELSPANEEAKLIREEVDSCLSWCKLKSMLAIFLGILFFSGLAAGLYLFPASRQWIFSKLGNKPKWVLEGIEGPCRGQVFPLDKNEMIIGSQGPPYGAADIVIVDPQNKISRRHCMIMQNGKQFYLVDESTNGVKINGHQVLKGALVEFRSGDRISLADVAVVLLKLQKT
jgi:hypothetical protein